MKFKIKSILILVAIALSIVTAQVVMAGKTVFSDGNPGMGIKGTKVTAAFLNSVNKHFCTGLDVDGDCALAYSTVTGTNDLITTITPTTAFPASYVVGMPIYLKSAATNTGAMTVNVNGLGVKAIKKGVNQALIAGDVQSGALITVIYDGTNFQIYNPDLRGVAFGAASLDTNTRLVQDANTVWDGTAGRSASPTPGANIIPVAGAGSTIADGFISLAAKYQAITPVYDYTVSGSAVTTMTTGGILDAATHGGYKVDLIIYNPTGGNVTYQVWFDSDTTASHYIRGSTWNTSETTANSLDLFNNIGTGHVWTITGDIWQHSVSGFGTIGSKWDILDQNCASGGSGQSSWTVHTAWTQTTNLTNITISSNTASGIGIGSRLRVWRKK